MRYWRKFRLRLAGKWGRLRLAARLFMAVLRTPPQKPAPTYFTALDWRLGEVHGLLDRWTAEVFPTPDHIEKWASAVGQVYGGGDGWKYPRNHQIRRLLWELRIVLGHEDVADGEIFA